MRLALLLGCLGMASAQTDPLVLVSFDGFPAYYYFSGEHNLPNFDRLLRRGVGVRGMTAAFVTNTFPTHYTLVTGRHAENHGIVNNRMWDPEFRTYFDMRNQEPRWWNDGEPLWVRAENQGVTSATYFWPGSEVEIRGVRPSYWHPYDGRVPFNTRVDGVLNWLRLPAAERPSFITTYFEEPDTTGHRAGPNSTDVANILQVVDRVLGRLLDGLDALPFPVNLVVTSDHGMAETSRERMIYLMDLVDTDLYFLVYAGANAALDPAPPREENRIKIYESLKGAHPQLEVYYKEDLPQRFHYTNHRRIMPIILIAAEGWVITNTRSTSCCGTHGYDNQLPSMRPILFATGPAFREGGEVLPPTSLSSVDLYWAMAQALGVSPGEHDGSIENARRLLRADYLNTTAPRKEKY